MNSIHAQKLEIPEVSTVLQDTFAGMRFLGIVGVYLVQKVAITPRFLGLAKAGGAFR